MIRVDGWRLMLLFVGLLLLEFVLLSQHERFNDSTPLPVGFLPEICRPFQLDYKLFKRELAGSVYLDI